VIKFLSMAGTDMLARSITLVISISLFPGG
jgi:hypothetical protein